MSVEIKNQNCLEGLKSLKDKSIDLTITSPPYNMNLRIRNGKYCSRQIVKEFTTKYEGGFNDNLPIDEYFEFQKNVIIELLRVSKIVFYNIQMLTGNKPALLKILGYFSDQIKDIIIWDKMTAQPAMGEKILNSRFEFIIVFGDTPMSRQFSKANFKRGTLENLWQIKRGKKLSKLHGATFPKELIDKILENFSKKGDAVLDPFAGIGTVGLSCFNLKRKFLGFEIDERYIQEFKNLLKKE
jgi:site-specific DNA-methyltransferase (adenine-specific)